MGWDHLSTLQIDGIKPPSSLPTVKEERVENQNEESFKVGHRMSYVDALKANLRPSNGDKSFEEG